jgi:hypothetical protein
LKYGELYDYKNSFNQQRAIILTFENGVSLTYSASGMGLKYPFSCWATDKTIGSEYSNTGHDPEKAAFYS